MAPVEKPGLDDVHAKEAPERPEDELDRAGSGARPGTRPRRPRPRSGGPSRGTGPESGRSGGSVAPSASGPDRPEPGRRAPGGADSAPRPSPAAARRGRWTSPSGGFRARGRSSGAAARSARTGAPPSIVRAISRARASGTRSSASTMSSHGVSTWSIAQFFWAADPRYSRWTTVTRGNSRAIRNRRVGREGVDEEDPIGEGEALEALADVRLLVEGGDDDGEGGTSWKFPISFLVSSRFRRTRDQKPETGNSRLERQCDHRRSLNPPSPALSRSSWPSRSPRRRRSPHPRVGCPSSPSRRSAASARETSR